MDYIDNKSKDYKKKKIINVIVRIFSFLLTISLIYCYICYIFCTKTGDDNPGTKCRGFIGEKRNTVEVLCLGSSFTSNGIIPSVLYSEYGVSSFNSSIWDTNCSFEFGLYDKCKEYQTPKLVIVDTGMFLDEGSYEPSDENNNFFAYPFTNHSRFSKLNRDDFVIKDLSLNEDHFSKAKGFYFLNKTTSFDSWGNEEGTNLNCVLSTEASTKLDSFVSETAKDGASVLFVTAPCQCYASFHNYFTAYVANKSQLAYLDFNDRAKNDDTGIDESTDFGKYCHLNVSGAQKCSISLGKYLHNNYTLTDYRTLGNKNSKMEYSLTYIKEWLKKEGIKQLF